LLALLAGLLGDEGVFEHHLGDRPDLVAATGKLDAAPVLATVLEAPFAAAAGVDLRLEDDGAAAELIECLLRLSGRGGDNAARNGSAGRRQQLFRLVFVNLHVESLGRRIWQALLFY